MPVEYHDLKNLRKELEDKIELLEEEFRKKVHYVNQKVENLRKQIRGL